MGCVSPSPLLAGAAWYEADEWAVIQRYAAELRDEAVSFGIDSRDYASARLVNLITKLADEPLDAAAENLRIDLATAAALVYVGRIA